MDIHHNKEQKRFFVVIDGKEAELTYRTESESVLNYSGTFTPPELRGQGLAGKITKHALLYAQYNGFKIIPGCPYVADYIDRHPEFKDLLA